MIIDEENLLMRFDNVVIGYPHFWEKSGMGEDQSKWSWGCEVILDPVKHAREIQELAQLVQKTLRNTGKQGMDPEAMSPLKNGDKYNVTRAAQGKEIREELKGKFFFRTNESRYHRTIIDQNRIPIPPEQSANVFGGCIMNVAVRLYWRNQLTNPGVSAGFMGAQLVDNVNVEKFAGSGGIDETKLFESISGSSPSWM